jgi:hypothetical protein
MTWPRKRVIEPCTKKAQGPLLTRYYLLATPWFSLYLHHLQASDEDRCFHDHPWSFVTFLLSSGYYEHCLVPGYDAGEYRRHVQVRRWRRRFSVLYRPAEWQHRLELVRPCWTLVLHFPRRRDWGFWTPTGWMDWRAYGKEWCE